MKNLTLSILVLISIYSCKKDESLTPLKKVNNSTENAEYDDGEERYEPVFKNYQSILTVSIGSANSCNNPHSYISIDYHYKLMEGVFDSSNYYYQLHRKTNYNYPDNPQVQAWHNTGYYYRYDYQNKKAYMYSNLNDLNPKLLMDFNLDVGDQFEIPNSGSKFNVDSVGTQLINDQLYPLLFGHLIITPLEKSSGPIDIDTLDFQYNNRNNYAQWHQNVKSSIMLSPYYPNPLYFDQTMDYYWSHDWTLNDFEEWIYLPYHNSFRFKLRDLQFGNNINYYHVLYDN